MTQLAQGRKASLVLSPGEAYRVSTPGTATVTPAYGAPGGVTTITSGFAEFGPYDAPAKLELNAVAQAADYALKQVAPAATIDITIAERDAPTAAMLADTRSTYRLSSPPYTRYTSNGTALAEAGGAGIDPVTETIPTPSGAVTLTTTRTLSSLEAAAAIPNKSRFVSNLGGGATLYSNGVRFKAPREILTDCLDADVSTTTANADATNGTKLAQLEFPKLARPGDRMFLDVMMSKSGITETVEWFFRFGPTGTATDPHIIFTPAGTTSPSGLGTPGSANMCTAANISLGTRLRWRFNSLTTIKKLGNATNANSNGGVSTVAKQDVATIGDISTAMQYLTIWAKKSATTEIITLDDALLYWLPSAKG